MEEPVTSGIPLANYSGGPTKKRAFLKWSILAAVLVFGYFVWQCGSGLNAGARLSDDAVRHFHAQLDSKAYGDIVRDSDEAFQNAESHEDTIEFLAGVHSKLGPSRDFSRINIFVNATTKGTFIRATYRSTFDQGSAIETFTWKKTSAGLKLLRYDVNSKIFVTR